MNSSAMMSPTTRTRRLPKPCTRARRRSLDMAKDPADRANEVVDSGIGGECRGRSPFLGTTIAAADQNAAAANRARQLHVQPPVADHERLPRIDAECLDRPVHEGSAGLAALASPRVRLDFAVGMVRTIVIRVQVRTALGEQRRHLSMNVVEDRLREEPARDARLIGDQDDAEARTVQCANRIDRPWIESEALDAIQISDFLDDRAVAIEEHGARLRKSHISRLTASAVAATEIPRIHP